jgi:putative DNA primase/helicase
MWLVLGYINYLEEGLVAPDVIKNATAGYFEEQDVFLRFLNENYVIDPNGRIAARTLYQHYQGWCVENGEKAVSNNKFGMEMTRLHVKKSRDQNGTFYFLTEKNI